MKRAASQGFANHLLLGSILAMGCFGSLGMGVVWMRHQISLEANANKTLQARLAGLERNIQENAAAIAAEKDPAMLARLNVAWNLGLVPPQPDQVRRVTEDPVMRLMAKHNRWLFGERPEVIGFRVAAQP
jgi:hypothetical protein